MTDFTGTAGNDTQDGTGGDDTFFYDQGGRDTLNGRGGDDHFAMGDTLRANDRLNGGGGFDTVQLFSPLTPYVMVFDNNTITNCETLQMSSGDYTITMADGNVAAGATFFVVAGADRMTIDGSAETDGFFTMDTTPGDDILIGGQQADNLFGGSVFFSAGVDTLRGEGGDDTLNFLDDLIPDDRANGGDGFDTVKLDGDYSIEVVMQNSTLNGIERILLDEFDAADTYYLTFADGNVTAGATLTVDGSAAGNVLLNGAAETNGQFAFYGGAETDVLGGGAKDDVIQGNLGADILGGAGGSDLFVYPAASHSTGIGHDQIVEFNANADKIVVPAVVTGIDAAVNSGTLNESNFDARLASRIDASRLGVDHAVLYKPSAGDFAGVQFLIVDLNATAGYQAGADLVLRLNSPTHLNNLDTGDFFGL